MIANLAKTDATTSFELIDAGTTRSDLASRREVKYAIPQMDVGKLRNLLQTNCRRLIHNDRVSVVRSIYFDDARLSACHANLDGLGMRRKLRLRWYDSLKPVVQVVVISGHRRLSLTRTHCHQPQAIGNRHDEPGHHEICGQRPARGIIGIDCQKCDREADCVAAGVTQEKPALQIEQERYEKAKCQQGNHLRYF